MSGEKVQYARLCAAAEKDTGIWRDEIDFLGFTFGMDRAFRIRASSFSKAKRRIRYWTSDAFGRPDNTVKKAVQNVNLFLGYSYRRKKDPVLGWFRIAPPKSDIKGFVRYFSSIGYSAQIESQMAELDALILGRLHELNSRTEKVKDIDFFTKGLRRARTLYLLKCGGLG